MNLAPHRLRQVALTFAALLAVLILAGCDTQANPGRRSAPVLKVRVIETFAHDPGAFTQGLEFDGATLVESTGRYGESTLRRVSLETGKVESNVELEEKYFGEGLTILNGRIYQLTWKERTCFVYDQSTLKLLKNFAYEGQGWGLANDGTHLFISSGKTSITVRDPESFEIVREFVVKDGRRRVSKLNELEYFDDHLYANVFETDRIAKIDPKSGAVVAWIDCGGMNPNVTSSGLIPNVLNGIAYDNKNDRLLLTGKLWSNLYEVEILTPQGRNDNSK